MKKVIVFLLAFVLIIVATGHVVSLYAAPFTDVTEDYASDAIERWASKGVIQGRGGRTFDPYATATRAEFAAMLTRIMGYQQIAPPGTFTDIQNSQGMNAYVLRAAAAGVFETGGAFRPNDPITRAEAAVAFSRALGLNIANVSPTHFVDDALFSATERGAIRAASNAGIINGRPAGSNQFAFQPHNNIIRKHLALMFDNAFSADVLVWPAPVSALGVYFNYIVDNSILGGVVTLIVIEPRADVTLPENYTFLVGGEAREFYWYGNIGPRGQYRLALEGSYIPADLNIIIN
ncbi:MAG: S-layer homology domain-containing protein [Defluviitaleaceae bacterium]|nr:S-layer homology domain-containing protein [Defluviitaleaceae bacterium]